MEERSRVPPLTFILSPTRGRGASEEEQQRRSISYAELSSAFELVRPLAATAFEPKNTGDDLTGGMVK